MKLPRDIIDYFFWECHLQSSQKFHRHLMDALELLIRADCKFAKDEFEAIASQISHSFPSDTEGLYAIAAQENRSAAIAYEQWVGRKPFIFRGKRLYVGYRFEWVDGKKWEVGSFRDDKGYVNCKYYEFNFDRTPTKLMKLTHAKIKEAERALAVQIIGTTVKVRRNGYLQDATVLDYGKISGTNHWNGKCLIVEIEEVPGIHLVSLDRGGAYSLVDRDRVPDEKVKINQSPELLAQCE